MFSKIKQITITWGKMLQPMKSTFLEKWVLNFNPLKSTFMWNSILYMFCKRNLNLGGVKRSEEAMRPF